MVGFIADYCIGFHRTFDKYDVDGDGFISMQDLEYALMHNQDRRPGSKTYTHAELRAWIADKDRSGLGVVSFHDFKKHFQQTM
jgi:Ca2+-binding EF-hand superfamily protein